MGVNIPIRIGNATVNAGRRGAGHQGGRDIIPPHLLQRSLSTPRTPASATCFGKMRLAQGTYTSGEIDVSTWPSTSRRTTGNG